MGEGWASLAARVVKNPPPKAGGARDTGSILGLGRCPGIGNGSPLPGRFHGQRNLAGSSPWGSQSARHDLVTEHTKHAWEEVSCCPEEVEQRGRRDGI